MAGDRYNNGKRRWGLLSWPALNQLVQVLEFGAKKYDSWNWTKGLSWSEAFESLQRHLLAWYIGEDKDPETGLSHMAHVMCNAMFLMHFILFKTGTDDRPAALKGAELTDAKQDRLKEIVQALQQPRDTVVKRGVLDVQANLRTENIGDDRD